MRQEAIIVICLGAVAVGAGYWLSRPKVYEAKWVYARAHAPVTIENGEVVLPPPEPPRLGPYQDQMRVSDVELGYFKKNGWCHRTVVERFFEGTNVSFDAAQASNAFESVRWRVRGNRELPVVEMSSRSESGELALAVMKCWADNLIAYREYENVRRKDLALMQLRAERKRLSEHGGDTADKDREIAEAIAEIEKHEEHIYTVAQPYVEQ